MIIWHPEDQIYPISSRMRAYFTSRAYRRLYDRYRHQHYGAHIRWADAPEIWRFSFRKDLLKKQFPDIEAGGEDYPEKISEDDAAISKRMALEAEMAGAGERLRAALIGEKHSVGKEEKRTRAEIEAEIEEME